MGDKSEGLFGVIAATRTLLDSVDNADALWQEELGVRVGEVSRSLDERVRVVETYASE